MAYIKWNGFTLKNAVSFDAYNSEPVYAEDGISQITTKHNMRGTAVITGSDALASGALTEAKFNDALTEARTALLRPRDASGDFVIAYGTDGGTPPSQTIISLPASEVRDQLDGPLATFAVHRIHGALSAVVTFDITWWWYEYHQVGAESALFSNPHSAPNEELSHRWTAKWEIDKLGMATRRVVGALVVRANATLAEGSTIMAAGGPVSPHPDSYRNLVTPALPDGFRREKLDYASDDSGLRLTYQIVDKEYSRDIPHPATAGNGTFIWQRARGGDMMGVKIYQVELSAGRKVEPGALYDAAMKMSRARIDYAKDHIMLFQVEQPLFGENTIRVKVVARAVDADAGDITPLNFELWDDIMAGGIAGGQPSSALSGYEDQNPYGGALLRSLKRALYTHTDSAAVASQSGVKDVAGGIPQAHMNPVHPTSPVPRHDFDHDWTGSVDTPTEQWVFEGPEFTDAMDKVINSDDNVDQHREANAANPYLEISIVDQIQVADTGLRLSRPMDLNGVDRPFQVRRPTVLLVQEGVMTRLGKSPEPQFRPPPDGAVLLSSTSKPTVGYIDGAHTHVFSAHYKRVWMLTDKAPGAFQQNGFGGRFAVWWPNPTGMSMPIDPRIHLGDQVPAVATIVPGPDKYRYLTGAVPPHSTPAQA